MNSAVNENITPFFSIIIPTFNRAHLLSKSIFSVKEQDFQDWELIIIDDASNDDTEALVNHFHEPRIKYLKNPVNIERSASRNRGIDFSLGHYICFLDSDDYYEKNHLSIFHQKIMELKEPKAMFFSNIMFVDENNTIRYSPRTHKKNYSDLENLFFELIGNPQVCIHREILKEEKYNEKYFIGEDLDLWVRIVNRFSLFHIDEYTVYALDHAARTISLKMNNSYLHNLRVLKNIFRNSELAKNISKKTRKEAISNSYFGIARYYIYKNNKFMAIITLLASILKYPRHDQTQHKIFLILNQLSLIKEKKL